MADVQLMKIGNEVIETDPEFAIVQCVHAQLLFFLVADRFPGLGTGSQLFTNRRTRSVDSLIRVCSIPRTRVAVRFVSSTSINSPFSFVTPWI